MDPTKMDHWNEFLTGSMILDNIDAGVMVYDEEGIPVHASVSVLRGENTSYIISTDNSNRQKISSPGR